MQQPNEISIPHHGIDPMRSRQEPLGGGNKIKIHWQRSHLQGHKVRDSTVPLLVVARVEHWTKTVFLRQNAGKAAVLINHGRG